MKHPTPVTLLLIGLFFAAQVIGLVLLAMNIDSISGSDGALSVEHGTTAIGDRPTTSGASSLLYLILGVAIGTAIVLLLIRFKAYKVWKVWFLIAIWFSMTIALGVVLPAIAALIICLGVAAWKVYYPNPYVHNVTEIFMYAGLAILLVPIFTISWVIALLLIISVYDIIAVWYSKHMVTMAKAQTQTNLFAGLYIPKPGAAPTPGKSSHASTPASGKQDKSTSGNAGGNAAGGTAAILGGGDIAFPLIFTGVVLDWLIMTGMSVQAALLACMTITITATAALTALFIYAKKDKFYPAMPFLSIGCLAGLGLIIIARMML